MARHTQNVKGARLNEKRPVKTGHRGSNWEVVSVFPDCHGFYGPSPCLRLRVTQRDPTGFSMWRFYTSNFEQAIADFASNGSPCLRVWANTRPHWSGLKGFGFACRLMCLHAEHFMPFSGSAHVT